MPDAILFDCDGVLADTERDGHRPAFNIAFGQRGLEDEWDVELYGELLEVGGGKERMTKYFSDRPNSPPWSNLQTDEERAQCVQELHLAKTEVFMDMIKRGDLPLRPGVRRLIGEAMQAGITIAICSTSNEKAVATIRDVLLGPEVSASMQVFAGDVVPRKKPDPAIYLLAAERLSLDPSRCVVVEDSGIGLQAAKAAGMKCIVTKSSYTQDEDFSIADAVVEELGDGADGVTLEDLTDEGMAALAGRS